jgi:hypothetical protein
MELQDEMTLPLRKPLMTAKGEIAALGLREPNAGELAKFTRAIPTEGSVAATLLLIALVSGIDKPFLEKLTARDFHEASDYLGGFMPASPKTGETASPT